MRPIKISTCGDCGCKEGSVHELGCDMEVCPFCGRQLVSCHCVYEKLGYNYNKALLFDGPERKAYEKGISKEEEKEWLEILNAKGRVAYIEWPQLCARCGALYPSFFRVADRTWNKYIQLDKRGCILCLSCFRQIVVLADNDTTVLNELNSMKFRR